MIERRTFAKGLAAFFAGFGLGFAHGSRRKPRAEIWPGTYGVQRRTDFSPVPPDEIHGRITCGKAVEPRHLIGLELESLQHPGHTYRIVEAEINPDGNGTYRARLELEA